MKLIDVYTRPDRHELLYRLLAERSTTVNISHRSMPCMGDHVRFVESKPYQAWYFLEAEPFGACYLSKQHEIGVFLFRDHQGKGYGRDAIKALMEKHGPGRYLANINPMNDRSRFLFAGLGFKCIQQTFELVA